MTITDLENTTVSRDLNLLNPLLHNFAGISVTPSATMRWTTLRGIDAALVGVNVNVTMVSFRIVCSSCCCCCLFVCYGCDHGFLSNESFLCCFEEFLGLMNDD
jgi:hypothetical protein